MHKNRRITLHQKIGKGIKFNYITSKNALKIVSGMQNVIIYVGTVIREYLAISMTAPGFQVLRHRRPPTGVSRAPSVPGSV